ncbi:MAG: glycosyltransferase [Chitinophagaceae bacterium]
MVILNVIIVFFILYSLLILYYWQSWKAIPDFSVSEKKPVTRISVIIPARNEEENIGRLLQALQQQHYPKELFKVLVVDDHSSDNTALIVLQFPEVILIQLKEDNINSYKKKAIETGILAAKGDLIVTTDADCVPAPGWLQTISVFKEENKSAFIAAPVLFSNDNSFLQIFQSLDFMVLQGITGASVYKNIHSMCNGANLTYEKKAFDNVNGFAGIDMIASGDDMLLMHKIWKQQPEKVHYLKSKEAIVSTQPMKTWKDFFNQRIRWASKAKSYDDWRIIFVLLLVYLFNLLFVGLLVAACWYPVYLLYFFILLIGKTLVELPFIFSVADFFGKKSLIKYFPLFQPLHILYTVVSGLFGQFGKYEWKGRRVR